MNILFFVNAFPSPDKPKSSPFNLRAVRQLMSYGMNVLVVHFRSWVPKRKFITRYEFEGVKVVSVSLPYYNNFKPVLQGLNLLLYKRMFAGLFKKHFREQYDVIHSVGTAHASIIASHISKVTGIPHIAQSIGTDANILLPGIKNVAGVKGFDKHVKVFTNNSLELEKQVGSLFPGSAQRTIYRGVDTDLFYPDPQKRPADHIRVLYLGGLSPKETKPFSYDQKGGLTLLKAWELFKDQSQNIAARLIYAGPHINADVLQSAVSKPLHKLDIEIAGQLTKDQVRSYMQSAHIVIIPSMFEGMPNVAMESSACGCAIIGTRVGGIPEIIEDGTNGLLVDRKDQVQLADRLLKLASNPQEIERMGREARRVVENRFDYRQFPEQYISLYRSVSKTNSKIDGVEVSTGS
jgi:glycosyltransferase involved in cell wall biosynthesis